MASDQREPDTDAREKPETQIGQLLTTPVYATFAEGISMATADEGRLVFRPDRNRGPADGPPELCVDCLAAVSVIPSRRGAEDPFLFTLTTAIADADGCLWQRMRNVTDAELWRIVLEDARLYPAFDRPSDAPWNRNAENVTRRVLLEPMETCCDGRWHSLIEVIREQDRAVSGADQVILPYECRELLLYRLRFKYFSAKLGLVEDDAVRRMAGRRDLVHCRTVVVTIDSPIDADLIVSLGKWDKVQRTEGPRLSALGRLCSPTLHLRARWEAPSWELPSRADAAAWEQEFREIGIDPSTVRAFRPNPAIHHEAGDRR